ncbi:deoxyguanosinetriphosphate triphosphohydrolase [Corynebacterium lowii]|uniref:Deoxyguanosinetriphosphate triphosphohydrolase-like protein n=1 Tax=Corynebacterium lowii TaxID=1544413 RepID=A0A0Q1E2P0_9CORY|nr:deoxyguanosinetriphosphate triphosphohydrolase [Corynebacterium lowii]KQB86854.1 Deoxyguanosinetriphosphate triphosphohydrolase [Corynebacterium lowii]MDP9851542.1 dGTPase [Corynebacterium lowii]
MSTRNTHSYTAEDTRRRLAEHAKGSTLGGTTQEQRSAFSRDRDRVLHSAALRRLADKTQVVRPRDGDTPRTRLTHSLEVAQIARGMGTGLGLDPHLAELAGLTHDIGHPPYGHNGERALNDVAQDCGGFEGNAQTLRILTRLEPKVLDEQGRSYGLNLTRAALDATCKYPRLRTRADGEKNKKYGCYDEDAAVLEWVRRGHEDETPAMEAQVMDWADDVAYSVHDVEDGIVSGRISLGVLWDFVELAKLAEKGARAFGGTQEELVEAADGLRQLPLVSACVEFNASLRAHATLKKLTSELVGRYVSATIDATLAANPGGSGWLGRTQGNLAVPDQARAEVKLLKTIAVLYVMDEHRHLVRQDQQRDRIYRVFDYLCAGAPGALDPMFRQWWQEAESDAARQRVVVDQIASMTESRLERLARRAASLADFWG